MLQEQMQTLFESHDLKFEPKFYEKCLVFMQLLQQWGAVHNLTAELSHQRIIDNILDSVYVLKFIHPCKSIADIGTGAGYPGMILALALPTTKLYLVEPRQKRAAFLNFVKSALKLDNVEVIQARIENVTSIQNIDLISSRAVSNTQLLLDLTQHISHKNTRYLFYKGSMLDDELKQSQEKLEYDIVSFKDRNYLYIKNKGAL
jgi:16S rRNA (guanine527-N7)-methyltransferase